MDCISEGTVPITNGRLGLEVVKILEASSESLRQQGAAVNLAAMVPWSNGHQNGHANGKNNGHGNGNGNGNGHGNGNGNGHGVVMPVTNQTLVAA
jgi:hypothetical protein